MKKLRTIFLVLALVLSLGLLASVPAAASSPVTLDPAWEIKENRLQVDMSPGGLNSALPSSDVSWGNWTTPVWTGDADGIEYYSHIINYWVSGDTWTGWVHPPQDWSTHTDGWLRTSVNIPANWIVTSVKLVDKYNPSTILSINDDLYVYIDGTYCAGGGTAAVPFVQALTGETPPDPTPYGTFVTALMSLEPNWLPAPATGWYIAGGLPLPASLFTPGEHEIQILTEEFDQSGGIGHPVFLIEYTEVTLTPPEAFNLVGTTHTVYATVTPPEAGITVNFTVSGNNTAYGTVDTNVNGVAEFTYTGTNPGKDTITATIGDVSLSVTKYWFLNFFTGGGNIKEVSTNAKGKSVEKVAWTFGGNVGYLEDGTLLGQFQIRDHEGKESWHCHNDFDSLIFWGSPTSSPTASLDHAEFIGTFTSNKGGEIYLRVTIWDDQEPGRDYDEIMVDVSTDSGATWNPWFSGEPISGGNLQVHEGYKG